MEISPFYAIIVAVLTALSAQLIKPIKSSMDPIMIWIMVQCITFVFAIFAVIYIWLYFPNKFTQLFSLKNVSRITVSTFIGPVVGYFLLVYMIAHTSNTSLVISLAYTVPMFSVILGYCFFKQAQNIYSIIGVAFITIGILVLMLA